MRLDFHIKEIERDLKHLHICNMLYTLEVVRYRERGSEREGERKRETKDSQGEKEREKREGGRLTDARCLFVLQPSPHPWL